MRYAPSPSPTLPKGKVFHPTYSNTAGKSSRPFGEGWGGAYTHSPGLRAKHATLGIYIIRCSNSVGVAVSRRRYSNENPSLPICRGIIQLSITPTAKRNSYRVANIVGAGTQGRGAARLNPGL